MQDKHHESAECFLFDEVLKLMAINVQSYLKNHTMIYTVIPNE